MKTKVSPATVGLFVIGAFALGIISLLTFGSVHVFAKPQRFVVYFDESIHGLGVSSPVKLRGVLIGRVADINIRYDEGTNRSVIAVVCEFSKNMVTDTKGKEIDVASRAELQTLVDRGLRAQLGVQGLATGLLFVELDFFDPKEFPPDHHTTELKYVAVPAVPSAISAFQSSASEILANLKKVDFAGLSRELTGLIKDARKRIDGVDLQGVVEQWKQTGVKVESLATAAAPEIKQTLANVDATLADLRSVLGKVDTQVAGNGAQLQAALTQAKETLASFNTAAESAQKFIAAQSGLGQESSRALAQLAEAAEAVQRLADFLERNPQALLMGKKPSK